MTAWEADRWLESDDWSQWHQGVRDGLERLGTAEDLAEFDAAVAGGQRLAADGGHSDMLRATLNEVSGHMIEAFADLGVPYSNQAKLRLKPTNRNDFAASSRRFKDGSEGIAVSLSLAALFDSYARFAAVPMAEILSDRTILRRRARAALQASVLNQPGPLHGFLRYTFINLRVFGLPAKLELRTTGQAHELASVFDLYALRFTIGHELAHLALGHHAVHHGFRPSEPGARSASQERETAADQLAFRALIRSIESEAAGMGWLRPHTLQLATLGAVTAFMAVYAEEHGACLRTASSHPPARHRIDQLLRQIGQDDQRMAGIVGPAFVTATDNASIFGPGAPIFSWDNLRAAAPAITTVQPASYLEQIEHWDRIMCAPEPTLREALTPAGAPPELSEGTRLLLAGETEAAITTWGLPLRYARMVCDMEAPLHFHSLTGILQSGFGTIGMPDPHRLAASVIAASLVAPRLTR